MKQAFLYSTKNYLWIKNYQVFLLLVISVVMYCNITSCSVQHAYGTGISKNLIAPPGTETDSTITLLWEKPDSCAAMMSFEVYQDGSLVATVNKTNYTATGLIPGKSYSFFVKTKDAKGRQSEPSETLVKNTKEAGDIFNVLSFGAKGDGITKNTKAIQEAIDACSPGGTVYIPSGTFLSGALFLKSDMTLYIAEGGILKGSADIDDYYPMILNRFEGWELKTFASLLTAGQLDRSGAYTTTNLSIRGKGTISGGGQVLGQAMMDVEGERGRGRLICLMNSQNVNIQGLTIEESPCWTIHYIYSKNIVCHDLTINSTADNGDGIDPDSSTDCYIFNCRFSTNDDCIAIKSGKNPEGYYIAKPTENVFISDCHFVEGHSLAVGSEMSGGVRNVVIRDCELGNLKHGVQIKVTKDRGGFVEDFKVKDCKLQKITIKTNVGYNNDGEPAPKLPFLRNMEFSDLDMSLADTSMAVIFVDGYPGIRNYTESLLFKNIKLPENAKIELNYCKEFKFQNVITVAGNKPAFQITNSENINY